MRRKTAAAGSHRYEELVVARHLSVILRSGEQDLTVENRFSVEQVVRIERTLHRTDALTTPKATGLPVFRELFPELWKEQTLTAGTLVEMADANFLAIRISNLNESLQDLSDAETYLLLNDFRRTFERQIQRQHAVIVDESSDILLDSFSNPVSAIRGRSRVLLDPGQSAISAKLEALWFSWGDPKRRESWKDFSGDLRLHTLN